MRKRLSAEALKMHSMQIESEHFPSVRTSTLAALPYTRGRIYNDEEYEMVKAIIENVPERKTFIHGDCHAGNVMLQGMS